MASQPSAAAAAAAETAATPPSNVLAVSVEADGKSPCAVALVQDENHRKRPQLLSLLFLEFIRTSNNALPWTLDPTLSPLTIACGHDSILLLGFSQSFVVDGQVVVEGFKAYLAALSVVLHDHILSFKADWLSGSHSPIVRWDLYSSDPDAQIWSALRAQLIQRAMCGRPCRLPLNCPSLSQQPKFRLRPQLSLNVVDWLLGPFLDHIQANVESIVSVAANDFDQLGSSLEVQAGHQILLTIENLKNAYQDSMQKTIKTLDQALQNYTNRLQNALELLTRGALDELQSCLDQLEKIVLELPFCQSLLVREARPHNIVLGDSSTHRSVTFSGVFPLKIQFSFNFEGKSCPLLSNTVDQLNFQLPADSEIVPTDKIFGVGTLTVVVPGGFLPWPHFGHTYTYKMFIGCLPSDPGNVTVMIRETENSYNERSFASPMFEVNGNYWWDLGQRSGATTRLTATPSPGWKFKAGCVPQLHYQYLHGGHNERIVSYDESSVVVEVWVQTSDGHSMGIVQFQVIHTETQTSTAVTPIPRPVLPPLNWGESRIITLSDGEELDYIEYHCWDGKLRQFGPADIGDAYLLIRNEGRQFFLSIRDPQ